jgi:pre-rRNA-processing protein TSR3
MPRVLIYHASQCDPKKCTGIRLHDMKRATIVHDLKRIPYSGIVLNPVSEIALSRADRLKIEKGGLIALDCSWKTAEDIFQSSKRGEQRALPYLLAANPINTYKPIKLSTAEAIAAALYIVGFKDEAYDLMSIFKWGHSFLTLNEAWLESYAECEDSTSVVEVQSEIMREHTRKE